MPDGTEVLVVGGGATGTGLARDLAMRGLEVTLVERGNLTHGTTGRMHGLLHSGARYADADPGSARDCIEENRIVRDIAGHAVEDTGGLFVALADDDPGYVEEKLAACRKCGIPAQRLTGAEARAREPHLAADVEAAIAVPDAAVDPFRLCVANAEDARRRGARIETRAEVTTLLREGDRVEGARVAHESGPGPKTHGEPGTVEEIRADHVVNAAGAWAGQLAATAGVEVDLRPSKGAMVVTNCRQLDTVVNRCRPKGDADIVVPHETTAILGTTDVAVADPDDYAEEGWEVEVLIDELSEVVPLLADARTLRSFWGVRPLYQPPDGDSEDPDTHDVTRDFAVLDHADRDGVAGLTSVVGGKFTTYRLMAERAADRVCASLGVRADCETAETPLPGSEATEAALAEFGLRSPVARRSRERLGSRADEVLDVDGPNPVLCDCEAVTRAEVDDALGSVDVGTDLNAVRIRTRASMGNCQGVRCCLPLAARLHPDHDAATARDALADLYAERWRGQRHALWGEQLAQAALGYALHATTMNRDRGPTDPGEAPAWDRFDAGPADAAGDAGRGGPRGPGADGPRGDADGD